MKTVDARLDAGDPAWDRLMGLLQAGFAVDSPAGLSLRDFMRRTLRFPDDYIEGSVSTVFLDSKPVDDIDAAGVAEGSLVALSAAMPGLVGAVMRRNSPYASFREAISWGPDGHTGSSIGDSCTVRVKLFNSVMRERGPDITSRGIIVRAAEAAIVAGNGSGAPGNHLAAYDEPVLLRINAPLGTAR